MKALKYVLYGLLGLVLLVVAAAVVLALTFDPNQYKDEVEKLVKERTGRTLKFHGDVKLAFYRQIRDHLKKRIQARFPALVPDGGKCQNPLT